MRFVVILLVSFVAHALAQVLHVKCGDEKCERPSNRAVTTLRYTPDKPHKLPINAVNSEVEIFGITDDGLYYIRHGKNYGFLPKNHLRERAKGIYPFNVDIDITNMRIDQQMREQNFLHMHAISSQQPLPNEVIVNETISETQAQPAPVHEEIHEHDVPSATEKPNSFPFDMGEGAKKNDPGEQQKIERRAEEANDSGIDEDEDDEEDDEDDEEESEETVKEEKKVEIEQPELIAIPPSRDEEPKAFPVPASASVDVPIVNDLKNVTEEEPAKIEEKVPEFIPMATEAAKEAETLLNPQNETATEVPVLAQNVQNETATEVPVLAQNVQNDTIVKPETGQPELLADDIEVIKPQETTPTPETPSPQVSTPDTPSLDSNMNFKNDTDSGAELDSGEEKETEKKEDKEKEKEDEPKELPVEKPSEPAIITEIIPESFIPVVAPPQEKPETVIENPEVKPETEKQPEVTPQPEEKPETTPPPPIEEPSTPPPVESPVTTAVPPRKIEDPEFVDMTGPPPPIRPEPDALLQRFNQKLGNRVVENSGKGTVEPLHRHGHNHDHGHHHDHDHSHHGHDHQDAKKPEVQQETTTPQPQVKPLETPKVDQKDEPGFFGGLFKKFFSDEDDSEQHFHKTAESIKAESVFTPKTDKSADSAYCEKIDSEDCPNSLKAKRELNFGKVETAEWKTIDEYFKLVLNEAIDQMDLIISLGLTALTCLIFTLGYYCINRARKEGPLIAKMNELERHLMLTVKENEALKGDIITTKQKLMSIEDNSFGSNDMVIALKQDLEESEQIKDELSEKVAQLEKELEAAAEDGLELNRMVSELLNNQTGSESIISSVEDLQRQLNEQQETIVTMNETLAAKSRENSELQIQLADFNGKFQGEFEKYQQQVDAVGLERTNLQIELENLKRESDMQVNQLIEERNNEVTRLNTELTTYAKSYEDAKKSLNVAESKVQAFDECLRAVKKDAKGGEFKDLFDVADLKADLLAVTKEKSTLQETLQNEKDSRKLLDDRVKTISEEMSNLKKEFGVAEKEKLEAQTRLEVLSTYFKEKETQIQQELSIKEARWMKQQGETTSTVEKVQALNDEIQTLKSQNDSLRAEIEAQVAAHKLSISSIEAQSHSAWLNARQAERKLEESRMESAALRRRLTSIAENPAGAGDLLNGLPSMINDTMNTIPSPIRVESPNNVNSMPPAPMMLPPFLSQGFMPGAPPPFLPPPPFMPPPGEMGPPLGRLMSPPPKRFTPTMRDDRDRYSPRGRGRYSPDSRYDDYTAFETETDYSPPPSPSPPRRGYSSPSDRSKKSKGGHSSAGSLESNPSSRRK